MPSVRQRRHSPIRLIALVIAASSITAASARVTPAARAAASRALGNVAFSIAVPQKRKLSNASFAFRVRPHYVSDETKSVQILTDGVHPVNIDIVQCYNICSVKFQVVAGSHLFTVKTFDLPGSRGNVLSLNSTGRVVVAAVGITVVRLTLEGIVQNIGLELADPVPTVGVPASILLTAHLEDAARQIIVGPARFYNAPVVLTTTDPVDGTLSKTLLASPADAQALSVAYSGARVGNITFSARASGLTGLVTSAVLFLQPVANTHKLYAVDFGINNVRLYSTQPGNPFLGTIGGYANVYVTTVAVDPATSRLYISKDPNIVNGGYVEVHGTASGYPLLTTIMGLDFPTAMAVDPVAGKLFVIESGFGHNDMNVYDTADGYRLVHTIGGLTGGSLAADPAAGKLYVGGFSGEAVSDIKIFSTRAGNALLATIGGFSYVQAVAVDAASGTLYVAEDDYRTGAGDIKVFGTANGYKLLTTIGGFSNVNGVAVDPSAHQLYVAESGFNSQWSSDVQVLSTTQGYPLLGEFGNMPYGIGSMAVSP